MPVARPVFGSVMMLCAIECGRSVMLPVSAPPAERQKALEAMDKDAFAMLKELTVLGYFSSEIGATQALAYDKVPGGYWGCLDLKPGQKGWATR
jgi:hypothetical protein